MMINRMPNKLQSMNMIHRTADSGELWLGDYYAAKNVNLLRQKNINSVLTAAAMLGISYPFSQQINHKIINAIDLPSYKMTPHFQEAFQFISNALKKGNVLVHCAAGISRSTTCVIVYLMRGEGMSFKQALDFVRAKRPIVCPNDGFQKELKRYQTIVKNLPALEKEKKKEGAQNSKKEAVLELPKQEKAQTGNKATNKMSSTFGGSLVPNSKGFLSNLSNNTAMFRGKSLNYSKKPNDLLQNDKTAKEQRQAKNPSDAKQDRQISKLTQQFLTFKLENPKIVTIKK